MVIPKVLLLDLGNVVFRLDWHEPIRRLQLENSPVEKILVKLIQTWGPYDQFERGKLSSEDFLHFVNQHTSQKIEKDEFIAAWLSLIPGYFEGMEALLEELSKDIPLYALTNTNPLHYDFIVSQYPEMRFFRKIFTSIHTGYRKPEREIFESVIEELEVEPSDVLYIDDTEGHVLAAKDFGFHAEHYHGNKALDLKQLLWKYQLSS